MTVMTKVGIGLFASPGAVDFAREHSCFWLFDVIASYVTTDSRFRTSPVLSSLTIWLCQKTGESRCRVIAVKDTDAESLRHPEIAQNVPCTDIWSQGASDPVKLYCSWQPRIRQHGGSSPSPSPGLFYVYLPSEY